MSPSSSLPPGGPRSIWPVRVAAASCSVVSLASAALGAKALFAGDWLEDHTVRYGALTILATALILALTAFVLAVVGLVRRPRSIVSWVVAGLGVLPIAIGVIAPQLLGI